MKKETVKKYKIQGLEFEFEKPCLKLTKHFEEIYDRYISFEKENPEFLSVKKNFNQLRSKILAGLSQQEILQVQKDGSKIFDYIKDETAKIDILVTIEEFTSLSLDIKKRFLNRNMKEILEVCLSGETEKIDYEVTGDKYFELRDSAMEVFNDFFLSMKD